MLGINDNKNKKNDLDDLLGGGPKLNNERQKKKATDFFGGLDDFWINLYINSIFFTNNHKYIKYVIKIKYHLLREITMLSPYID